MGIPAVSFPKDGPTKTNQPKQTIEQPNETKIMATNNKTSTPKSSINGVHAVVQHRGPVPSSALQKQTRGTPNTSPNSLVSSIMVCAYRSTARSGGTWPLIGEKSQQLLKSITWVVSISRGVPPSLHHSPAELRRVAAPPRNKTQRKTNSEFENVWENNERGTPLKWTRR